MLALMPFELTRQERRALALLLVLVALALLGMWVLG